MNDRGFTLAELLIAISLMSIIAGVVTATIMGGTQLWQRLQCQGFQDKEILLAVEEMRRGLHNYHAFEPIEFEGKYDQVSFPTMITVNHGAEKEVREPGMRRYFLNRKEDVICRSEVPYRLMRKRDLKNVCKPLAENVDILSFQYLKKDENDEKPVWSKKWIAPQAPISLKMDLRYHDRCSEEKIRRSYTITFPTGTSG